MDLALEGKSVLVTGGSKGIGRASAQLFGMEGCDIALVARTEKSLEMAAEDMRSATGRRVVPLPGDMSVQADVDRVTGQAIEALGKIDILVTCAGSSPGGLMEDLTEEQWYSSLSLKFMGYVRYA